MANDETTPEFDSDFTELLRQRDRLQEQLVEPLLPYESYPETGLGYAMSAMGFMMGRNRYVDQYGFVLLTRECVDAICALVAGKLVLEVGAGTGFLAHCLAEQGVKIVAQDMTSPEDGSKYFSPKKPWKLDHVGPFEERLTAEFGFVLMSWPCMGTPFAMNVAKSMVPGQVLIYQGEGWGGCTAADDFFEYIDGPEWEVQSDATSSLNEHHRQFPAIHDRWLVIKKK